ncbi:MAG: hypothetical protein AAF449_18585, partial [Myxococcota bacterium]
MKDGVVRFGALVLFTGLVACADKDRPTAPPRAALAPLITWGFSGCSEVRPGPICELAPDRSLHVWARLERGQLLLLRSPAGTVTATKTLDGGLRWRLPFVPGSVRLEAVNDGRVTHHPLRVVAAPSSVCPVVLPNFGVATDMQIETLERRIRNAPTARRADCWRAAGLAARITPRWSTQSLEWLARARDGFAQAGRLQTRWRTEAARAYTMIDQGQPVQARVALEPYVFTASISPSLRLPMLSTYAYASFEVADLAGAQRAAAEA